MKITSLPIHKEIGILALSIVLLQFSALAQLPVDTVGWTVFSPSEDSRLIYVSSAEGDDETGIIYNASMVENPFLPGNEIMPFASIEQAKNLVRSGFADWLLLKKGDEWSEPIGYWNKSGKSEEEPILIGSYGAATERPLLNTGFSEGLNTQGGSDSPPVENLAVVGIHFYANYRDPNSPDFEGSEESTGIRMLQPGRNILIEDCQFRFYKDNIVMQAYESANDGSDEIVNVKIRRSIITDAYSPTSHAQGVYFSGVRDFVIEENVFDHNGWNADIDDAGRTKFNHNIYVQFGVEGSRIVRNNILCRASSHGLQMRPGGVVHENLFLKNAMAMFVASDSSYVVNNVVLDALDIASDEPRGAGIDLLANLPMALVKNNIVANKTSAVGNHSAFVMGGGSDLDTYDYANITLQENKTYNWSGPMMRVVRDSYENIKLIRNAFVDSISASYLVDFKNAYLEDEVYFEQNRYFSTRDTSDWFKIVTDIVGPASWEVLSNEDQPNFSPFGYYDPTRSVVTYQAQIGEPNDYESFITAIRSQSKSTWDPRYFARTVNEYIRGGFALPSDCLPEDVNCDGQVDITDLILILGDWGNDNFSDSDVNGDGNVDVLDLQFILNNWND